MSAIPGQGAIVLTSGGDVLLLSPFAVIASDPFGDSGGQFVTVRHGGLRDPPIRCRFGSGEDRTASLPVSRDSHPIARGSEP